MIKKIAFIVLVFSFSWACQEEVHPYQAEINEVDSLLVVVEHLEAQIDSVDMDRINQEMPQLEEIYKTLVNSGVDQNDKNFWVKTVNGVVLVKEPYEKFLEEGPEIKSALQETAKQLRTLRNSLEDQQLEKDKVQQYLSTERDMVKKASLKVRKRQPPVKLAMELWDSTRVYYDSLAQELSKGAESLGK
jgi:hypothetical protein